LHEVVLYQPELCTDIEKMLNSIDISVYKDSMSSLIEKDIKELR